MYNAFDLDAFVKDKIIRRSESLLAADFSRHEAALDEQLDGAAVLVIGGAGTIGSNYIKALLRFPVARVCVVDTDENGLTELVRDLRSSQEGLIPGEFITYPVNFGDPVFARLFAARGPFDIVANFAAHKHVRSEKDVFSIQAMIENNLLRAQNLLETLRQHPPRHFFCVSTDKAANPVNIMGASKKLMEELIMAYADIFRVKTARFANVAFSNGSLPAGFLQRLVKRQPWSCPTDIRRYFVSPTESGELCLLASVLGESGDIVFPKLDESSDMTTFDQVARDLLGALGLEADPCFTEEEAREKMKAFKKTPGLNRYPVLFFTSDTSGEKPFEEFFTEGEAVDWSKFVNLGVVKPARQRTRQEMDRVCHDLRYCFTQPGVSKADVVEVLSRWLPEFCHIETGKALDQKM